MPGGLGSFEGAAAAMLLPRCCCRPAAPAAAGLLDRPHCCCRSSWPSPSAGSLAGMHPVAAGSTVVTARASKSKPGLPPGPTAGTCRAGDAAAPKPAATRCCTRSSCCCAASRSLQEACGRPTMCVELSGQVSALQAGPALLVSRNGSSASAGSPCNCASPTLAHPHLRASKISLCSMLTVADCCSKATRSRACSLCSSLSRLATCAPRKQGLCGLAVLASNCAVTLAHFLFLQPGLARRIPRPLFAVTPPVARL